MFQFGTLCFLRYRILFLFFGVIGSVCILLLSYIIRMICLYSVKCSRQLLLFFFIFLRFCQAAHHCGAFIQKHSSIVTVFLSLTHSHVFV